MTDWFSEAAPPVADLLEGLRVVSIPLAVPFRGIAQRECALLTGPQGWGEFAPFLEYSPAQCAPWLASAVEAGWGRWPDPIRDQIPVNATVPAVSAGQVPAVLGRFPGCRTVKVKVAQAGQSLTDDVNRVAAVRSVVGAQVALRVDANGAWGVEEAESAIKALNGYGLEYVEQPCASVADLARLRVRLARSGVAVPIAADESVRRAADPLAVVRAAAADLLVIKVAPLGGVGPALSLVAEAGLPAVVSSALDTSVGIAAGVALAAALPQLPYACGLGTVQLLHGDVVGHSLVPRDGRMLVPASCRPPAVDPQRVDLWEGSAARVAWWRQRLRDTYSAWQG